MDRDRFWLADARFSRIEPHFRETREASRVSTTAGWSEASSMLRSGVLLD